MKAVILAAGRGKRFMPFTKVLPKPAIKFNNLPIVLSNFNSLSNLGIKDIGIVVGYKAEVIFDQVGNGSEYGFNVNYIYNEEWEMGNGISLLKAKEFVKNENFILLMSDHVFDEEIIKELVEYENKIMGPEEVAGGIASQKIESLDKSIVSEATKLLVNGNGEVLKFGKKLNEYNNIDIGAFILKPIAFKAAEELKKIKPNVSVSDCMNWLISNNHKITSIDVTGKYWQDFDFIDDLCKFKK